MSKTLTFMLSQQLSTVVMNGYTTRRLFLQSAGVTSAITIAGCLGGGSDNDTSDEDTSSGTSDEDTSADTSDIESIFVNYGIDGTEFSVELKEDALAQVAELRLETPSEEKTADVAQTITEYSLDILRDRAGTWFLDALDDNEEPIETVELEPTFDVSVNEIGTLSQLDVTGDSPADEEVKFQLTVTNTGEVPIEPSLIEVVIPEADIRQSVAKINALREVDNVSSLGGLVDRDEQTVMIAGEDNTYRYIVLSSGSPLIFRDEETGKQYAGETLDGELIIDYSANREDTIVPVTFEMGDEVITDPEGISSPHLQGTVINKR